jgi:hypothetical protein
MLQDSRMGEVRGPTDAERRAVQQAVDAGDMKRAEDLLAGVRRRLARSNTKKNKNKYAAPTGKPTGAAKTKKPKNSKVRQVGTSRYVHCPICQRELSVKQDGRLRSHKNQSRTGTCHGSGAKVAKAWRSAKSGGNSIRTVSGGLPGLGKRR